MRKLSRLAFAKLALVSPFVARALLSDGSREAKAQSYCSYVDGKCAAGCDAPGCSFNCNRAPYNGCSVCQTCRRDAECAQAAFYCADGCSTTCRNRCSVRAAGCPACEVCDPE